MKIRFATNGYQLFFVLIEKGRYCKRCKRATKTRAGDNEYKYNGKELNEEFGLDWLDYGFRWYDPAIGRFTGVDPIAEQFKHVTTYNYAENEPVAGIYLWGLQRIRYDLEFEFNLGVGKTLGAEGKALGLEVGGKIDNGTEQMGFVLSTDESSFKHSLTEGRALSLGLVGFENKKSIDLLNLDIQGSAYKATVPKQSFSTNQETEFTFSFIGANGKTTETKDGVFNISESTSSLGSATSTATVSRRIGAFNGIDKGKFSSSSVNSKNSTSSEIPLVGFSVNAFFRVEAELRLKVSCEELKPRNGTDWTKHALLRVQKF